jgi:RNA-directed DNA polymerase
MMHGHEKSDLAIVAGKPANKANEPHAEASAEVSAAEPAEPRAGTKGNAGQQSTGRTQNRGTVDQTLCHPDLPVGVGRVGWVHTEQPQ